MVTGRLRPLLTPIRKPEAVALAREVAHTLYKLGDSGTLTAGLGSHDPEVRKISASSGAGGVALCALLQSDPWPMVRVGAAQGLAVHPDGAPCLVKALNNRRPVVKAAVITALGELGVAKVVPSLNAIALDIQHDLQVRRASLLALGNLSQTKVAGHVLNTHLRHGEMTDLAQVAVVALSLAKAPEEVFVSALASSAPTVLLSAARALIQRNRKRYSKAVKEIKGKLSGRFREQLELILISPVSAHSLGKDLITDAPEDE